MEDYQSLSHTKWNCKYHIVFIPKYRRKRLFGVVRREPGTVFRRLAEQKQSRLEGHIMVDHVHLLLSIPPKLSVSSVVGLLSVRGSTLPEPERRHLAFAAARTAVESEQALASSRFQEQRRRGRIFLSLGPEFTAYAIALGERADSPVAEEPLPTPPRCSKTSRASRSRRWPFPI